MTLAAAHPDSGDWTMRTVMRRVALFVPPALVIAFELGHPIVLPPIYPAVVSHMPGWLYLHLANLALFPLLGLAAYLLVRDVRNRAASLSRIAIAAFVPLYAAFDALAGIGTGVLVQGTRLLPPGRRVAAASLVDVYWNSGTLFAIAAVASVAWVVAMLAAAVAVTRPERRRLAAIVAVVLFPIGGWAETKLFLPSGGRIPLAWWLVTLGMGLAMFLASRGSLPAGLLVLAGSLFGAAHVPPTGPLGAACFLAAAAYQELVRGRNAEPSERAVR
jgi:hypothetical protein